MYIYTDNLYAHLDAIYISFNVEYSLPHAFAETAEMVTLCLPCLGREELVISLK